MPGLVERLTGAISPAILLREAARSSRRWQTYFARTLFSGVLLGVLLLGMGAAMDAARSEQVDAADLGRFGRGLFIGFSAAQILLAILIAPLGASAAILEETDERTMEMLVLTALRPGQILGAAVLSRIGLLLAAAFGALPVTAMVVSLGGVGAVEILAAASHTLTAVAVMSALGALFALFTRSPALATTASALYAVPFFVLLPAVHALATGDPSDVARFSPFAAGLASDPSALLAPLSFLPALGMIASLAVPVFALRVSNAEARQAFSERIWGTSRWLSAGAGLLVLGALTLPFAIPGAWWLEDAHPPPFGAATGPIHALAEGWIWLWSTALCALGTWAYLRVGTDVVDGLDEMFTGGGPAPTRSRPSRRVWGSNPVWWREASPRAWAGTAAPIFVAWGMVTLQVLLTGGELPGGLLGPGAASGAAAILFGAWLAARSVAEERRRGTLELLAATTLRAESIVLGKLFGAALPATPLLAASLLLLALGQARLPTEIPGPEGALDPVARGLWLWLWLLSVFALALALSLGASFWSRRPRGAFPAAAFALAALYGVPAALGRTFPDLAPIAIPARLIAPPLAGGASGWQLGASALLTALAALAALAVLVRRLRRWIGAAILAGLALGGPARAEPPGPLRMIARPLAEGISREGRLTTLWIRIENLGPSTEGTVSLPQRSADGSARLWERRVELPEGADRELLLLFDPGIEGPDRVLGLTTREGLRAQAPFRLRPVDPEDVSIGVIGSDPLGLPAVLTAATAEPVPGRAHRPRDGACSERRVHTGLVAPEALPLQSAGWGAIDWAVWPDADPSGISADRLEALRAWVADGGHLLLTVSDTWRQLGESPLGPALPVILEGQRDAEVGALGALLGLDGGISPIAASRIRQGRGAVVRASAPEGDPLWISAPYGLGSLHLITADLEISPLGIRGREGALRRLLALPAPGGSAVDQLALEPEAAGALRRMLNLDPVLEPRGPATERLWEARVRARLSDISGVAPLPISWLLALGSAYLLAIGPLDFLVLRALRRQTLTFVTFPLTVALFSGASLWLISATKGSRAATVRVELVDLLPGTDLWRGSTWLGVFSTRKAALSLSDARPDSVLVPLSDPGFLEDPRIEAGGGPGRIAWRAETWTLAYARSDWTAPAGGGLEARRDGERWLLRNALGFDLEAVGLSLPGPAGSGRVDGWIRLGRLDDGEEIEIPSAPPIHRPGAARPEDPLEWALSTAPASLPAGRGAIRAEQTLLAVGISTDHPIAPISVTGLSPSERPLTVIRAPLPEIRLTIDTTESR